MPAALVAMLIIAGCGESGTDGDASGRQGDPAKAAGQNAAAKAKLRARARAHARQRAHRKAVSKRNRPRKAKPVRLKTGRPTGDLDCGAFSNQAQAQRRLTRGDPYGLDGDGDRLACTSLPCPCSKARPKRGSGPAKAGLPQAAAFRAQVESVTDGDTLDLVTASGHEVTIRLIGIDTPEVYGGVECGGRAASSEMKVLAIGAVTVRTDPTQDRIDRYGRLLAYVNKGSLDLGRAMIARGLASAYIYDEVFLRYPAYHRSEKAAKSTDRGSWDHCNLSPG